MSEQSSSSQLPNTLNISKLNKSRSAERKVFKRNPNLFHYVHALLHLSQFITASSIGIFNYVHHHINASASEIDADIPTLPQDSILILIIVPISMAISSVLGIIWIIPKKIHKKVELGLIGCSFGATLMLLDAIFSMRDAYEYINIEEVSDEDLLDHPIYIHTFTICILCIFAHAIYLLHFWLLYECWRWERKLKVSEETIHKSSEQSIHQTSSWVNDVVDSFSDISEKISPKQSDSDDFFSSDTSMENEEIINTHDHIQIKNVEDEPVILYCFCIDLWYYIRHSNKQNTTDQNEDTEVM